MSNIIRFPSGNMTVMSEFETKFHDRKKNLPPDLSKCLKEMFERVSADHGQDLPSFELHVSGGLNDSQVGEIRAAVADLMACYRERILAMLKHIMELESAICMSKFSSDK